MKPKTLPKTAGANRVGSGPFVRRWWYTARVENYQGIHGVFYSTTRPKIGDTCAGIAAPNRIIGYRRELAPYAASPNVR